MTGVALVFAACWIATGVLAAIVLEAHVRTRGHGYEVHVAQAMAVVENAELRRHVDELTPIHDALICEQYEEDFQ